MALLAEIFKRAPLCGAFLLCLLLPPSFTFAESCSPCRAGLIGVASVYDGDTLRLEDGRKVRLVGVNTPELGRGKADEANALQARDLLERLVNRSGGSVRVCQDAEASDRYGRLLAHLYDRDAKSINRELLAQGAGYLITVPPNLKNQGCYKGAESEARRDRKGVWRHRVKEASGLSGNETGFHVLSGYVIRVGESRSGVWLNLEGGLALRITWGDWERFGIDDPQSLHYTHLEARGWIYHHNGNQRMRVRHPSSVRWLER
jgi:endonuclease YncB( thermonuclease family)